MKDGLYVVAFRSRMAAGTGVVMIKDGALNGGDHGYIYQGKITPQDGNSATSVIAVTRYDNSAESVFGPATNFNLLLQGTVEQETFSLEGNVEGQPNEQIRINGRFVKELV